MKQDFGGYSSKIYNQNKKRTSVSESRVISRVVKPSKYYTFYKFIKFCVKLVTLPFGLLIWIGRPFANLFKKIDSLSWLKYSFVVLMVLVTLAFANLQIFNRIYNQSNSGSLFINRNIVLAKRGSIYISDYSQGGNIKITESEMYITIFVDPSGLKGVLESGKFSQSEVVENLSLNLNVSYNEVKSFLDTELNREKVKSYAILQKQALAKQKETVEFLRSSESESVAKFNYSHWLGYEDISIRTYPYNKFMGSMLGYVRNTPAIRDEAIEFLGCEQMIKDNENRGTVKSLTGEAEDGVYTVGVYGLEQKFCSELGGLNGRQILANEAGTDKEKDSIVRNGSDFYLTIDRNLQTKAEALLQEAIERNTNSVGAPKNGSIIVMNSKTGAVVAMASTPSGDPNKYYNYTDGFLNTSTSTDYEAGSVIKSLTVAMALNEYEKGATDSKGNLLGVSDNWTFEDYNYLGKPYQELNGNVRYIKNAEGRTFASLGKLGLNDCLRYSINTCLATIQETVGNEKTKEYFEDKYLFGKKALVNFPGDSSGYTEPFETDLNIDFSYGSFSFGQGYRTSPLQLARAYTVLANKGKLVEPYIVEKTVENGGKGLESTKSNSENAKVKQPSSVQVISESAARKVTDYLTYTVNEGYRTNIQGKVDGYNVAGKSGTAQVSRADSYNAGKCVAGESIQDCNTRLGIYDHTFIGYGPSRDPEYIVLVKLSEPVPGVNKNYAGNTIGITFSEMMKYTLEYMGVAKDY